MSALADRPEIRPAAPEDLPGLSRLFGRHYAQHKPPAYFDWQFFSPEAPATLSVAVGPGGEVVGTFGFMRRVLTDGTPAGQVMDMLIDNPYRGRGLFAALAAHAFAAFPDTRLRLVLTNAAGTAAMRRLPGWEVLARVPVHVAAPSAAPAAVPDGNASTPPERLGIRYDPAVESWRFDRHPFNRYHRLEAAGLHGYLKLFVDPSDPTLRFGDILRVPVRPSAAAALWLRAALEWFRGQGARSCGLWSLPGAPAAEIARQAGFTARDQERWLCVQAVDTDARNALDGGLWDVCAADAEFY